MQFTNPEELKEFHKELGVIIENLNVENPLDTISFAYSLINMGTHLINQSSSKLITKAFSRKEVMKLNKDLETRKPLKEV